MYTQDRYRMNTQIDKKNEYTYKQEYSIVEGEYRSSVVRYTQIQVKQTQILNRQILDKQRCMLDIEKTFKTGKSTYR